MNVQKQSLIANKLLDAGLDFEHINAWAAFVTVKGLPDTPLEMRENCFHPDGGVILSELAKAAYAEGVEAGRRKMQEEIRDTISKSLGINLTNTLIHS